MRCGSTAYISQARGQADGHPRAAIAQRPHSGQPQPLTLRHLRILTTLARA
jgi:hypothetical protein